MQKKIFSLLLALCLLLSFAPMAAFAANTIQVYSAEEFEDALASEEGTTIQFEESFFINRGYDIKHLAKLQMGKGANL